MSDTTETKKSTARAAAMAKTWAARREWAANPMCCCGCGAKLAIAKDPKGQRLFCQGHDGRLHKFLRQGLRGGGVVRGSARAAAGGAVWGCCVLYINKKKKKKNSPHPQPQPPPTRRSAE